MLKTLRKRTLCALLALTLLVVAAAPALAVPTDPAKQLDLLKLIDETITQEYLYSDGQSHLPDDLTPEDFDVNQRRFYSELDKLTEPLDRYSGFIPEEWLYFYDMDEEAVQTMVGLGVTMYGGVGGVYILHTFPGGPAEKAGLMRNDQVVSVNGTDVRRMDVYEISDFLSDRKGTQVTLGIRRPGALADVFYTLTRSEFVISNVYGYALNDRVGYIRLEQFESLSDVQSFGTELKRFGELGLSDLIFDLRGNPGGRVDVAEAILNMLGGTRGETLFTFYDNAGDVREIYTYEPTAGWKPDNMVILVDGNSASASEVVSGSLADRGYASLLGTVTYGKGIAQAGFFLLPYDDLLMLTFRSIELPVTGFYHGEGLAPDVEVPLDVSELDVSQLEKLDASRALLPGLSSPSRVLALEQRLRLAGFFLAEPDDVFDAYTLHALNCFQMAEGLTVTSYAGVQTLEALEEYMELIDGVEYAFNDNQLEAALDVLMRLEAAA